MFQLGPPAKLVSTAGALSIASLIAFGGVAQAASVPVVGYNINGDTVKTTVTGNERTGVWRVRYISPSGNRRLDIVLSSGDVAWSGSVRVSRRQGNSWSLVSNRSLDEALAGGAPMAGCNAGICWDSALFRLPRNGDARFAVTVEMTRPGTYTVSGGVRQASEAFIFGRWLTSAGRPVTH